MPASLASFTLGLTPIATTASSQGSSVPLLSLTAVSLPSSPRKAARPFRVITLAFLLFTWFSTSFAISQSRKVRSWGRSSTTVISIPASSRASLVSMPIKPPPMMTAFLIVPSSRTFLR
jgi:hypothetical protein